MWDYDGSPPTKQEILFRRYLESVWNRSDISHTFARVWALYTYLKETPHASADALWRDVRRNNVPFFTQSQASTVWNVLHGQQTGGAFVDNLGQFIYERIKPYAPGVFGTFESIYSFATLPFSLLNSLKEQTSLAPFIDFGIANYSKLLPKLLTALEPYMVAGTGGLALIPQAIAAGNAAMLHMVVGEPVSAFVAILTAIPLVGPPVVTMIHQLESSYDDLAKQRERIGQTVFAPIFEEYVGAIMDDFERMDNA